jgi:hypothetical protein
MIIIIIIIIKNNNARARITDLLKKRDVKITIEFLRIGEIDTMNEKYNAEIRIDAKWLEKDTTIEKYNPEQHWNPKLFIENASFDKSNVEDINYFAKKINDQIQVTETRNFKGTIWERMEINDFPFDIQELTVCVSSKRNLNSCRIIPDSSRFTEINDEKYSALSEQVIKTFRHQQQYKVG